MVIVDLEHVLALPKHFWVWHIVSLLGGGALRISEKLETLSLTPTT